MASPDRTALRHVGVPETVRQLTQVSFVIRLAAILLAMIASVGTAWELVDLVAIIVVAGLSFFGLMNTRYLPIVREHPMIALLDALVVSVAVTLSGPDTPLILALLGTALLVGLWADLWGGSIVIATLICLYLVSLTTDPLEAESSFTAVVVLPFVVVAFWALGLVVARSSRHQQVTDSMVREAVVTAATAAERTRVAQELHDSLAKTLQGMTLTATAIPTLMERDPELARASTEELRGLGVLAVSQVRDIMTGLRQQASQVPLSVAVVQLATAWQERHDRRAELNIAELDTSDEAVRYELLTVCEEALDNVARHAGPCRVVVSLQLVSQDLVLAIRDFGRGTDADALAAARAAGHHGVTGMHERMARIGGACEVISIPGEGTTVECRVNRSGLVER